MCASAAACFLPLNVLGWLAHKQIISKYAPTINTAAREFNQLVESYKLPLPQMPLIDEAINGEDGRHSVLNTAAYQPEEVTESSEPER